MPQAYATIDDMIARYGDAEMRRVCVVDGEVPDEIIPDRIMRALIEVSSVADSYLSVKVPVPVQAVPQALTRAVCQLARCDLWTGGDRTPSEDVRAGQTEALAWLKAIADGRAVLDDPTTVTTITSGARVTDRPRDLSYETMRSLG